VFWAENQQIFSAVDATGYLVQADSIIYVGGQEVQLREGDSVSRSSQRSTTRAPVRARLDPIQNSLVLETTTPHQLWIDEEPRIPACSATWES
jgi:flagellar hook-associated protein 3 FlgL